MRRIRLLLQYDGTAYEGWQSQRSGNTIQDILELRLEKICGERPRLTGAGRTDAGVHALGQVAAFSTESLLPADTFRRALNATLPPDIRVVASEDVRPDFHPRYDALKKRYVYNASVRTEATAFLGRYIWELKDRIDTEIMELAARALVGTHDYSSFQGSGCSAKSPVRTVSTIEVSRTNEMPFLGCAFPGDFIVVRIEADAFLRHMVRNIVGTLVEAGKGRISAESVAGILRSRDRTKAGPTAPAKGLLLETVFYD